MIRSRGHCNTMGTASTMAPGRRGARHRRCPGLAGTPAAGQPAARGRARAPAGWPSRWSPPTGGPARSSAEASFLNAIVALAAIGGSTNAVVHLLAIAGRLGIELTLDDFDRIGSRVPLLVDLQPAGRFLMEDFHRAGGLLAVLREVRDLLDPAALTVTGQPLVDYLDDAAIWDPEVIRPRVGAARRPTPASPCCAATSPRTAPSIKPAAASPHLLQHRGRAVVFDSIEDFHARIDDPDLDVDADSVLVLRGCGPKGYPGHARGRRTCRCRRSCSSRACATWSGSATAG